MDKILVSACLMGESVRHDGGHRGLRHPALEIWRDQGRLVVFCPEVEAGLQVPRPPAEITPGGNGGAVLAGRARVVEAGGRDVTDAFCAGAEAALDLARAEDCRFALLKQGSPSCGSGLIHDGRFAGTLRLGDGVTAALLRAAGIAVFGEERIDELAAALARDT